MATVKDLLAYLLQEYPHKNEMSNARVTKLIYLCDWKHCLDHRSQITNIEWYFDSYGPFVWDVIDTAKEHPRLFSVEAGSNLYGASKQLIRCLNSRYKPVLTQTEREVAKHIIQITKGLTWDGFISLVYSTYPIITSNRYQRLDLPKLARQYKTSMVASA